VNVTLPASGTYTASAVCPVTTDFSPFAAGNTVNGKYPPLYYPSLGGAVVANYAMGNTADLVNPTETKFGAFSLFDNNVSLGSNPNQYKSGQSGGRYYTMQLCSALFGASADKYLPMSAINGMRFTLSCENVIGAFVINGLNYHGTVAGDTANSVASVNIYDPTFFLNMVRVDPTVDAQLIKAAQNPDDGNIRIHSQTYSMYQMSLLAGQSAFEFIIPVKVSSLKAIYFTFAPQNYLGYENFTSSQGYSSLGGRVMTGAGTAVNGSTPANPYVDNRVMKTTWFQNNLLTYQFFLDGKPTPASPVYIRNGYSENLAELSRALHFGHKSGDGQYLSLLDDEGTYQDQNFILGQEFESFSQKGPVIESGVNTLNSLMTLRLTFNQGLFYNGTTYQTLSGTAPTAATAYNFYSNGNPEPCYLKIFALYDTFLTITPGTGIMRTEN